MHKTRDPSLQLWQMERRVPFQDILSRVGFFFYRKNDPPENEKQTILFLALIFYVKMEYLYNSPSESKMNIRFGHRRPNSEIQY